MAVRRSFSPTKSTEPSRSRTNNLRNSTNYNFRVQSAPPLSLQQHIRSQVFAAGTKKWQATGKHRPATFNLYVSPQIREKPKVPAVKPWTHSYKPKQIIPTYSLKQYNEPIRKPPEPVWSHPGRSVDKRPTSLSPAIKPQKRIQEPVWSHPGHYVEKRPTSLSPEVKPQKRIQEPVWQHVGKIEHKPVPYHDPPNLRWSLQDLIRSTPDLRTKCARVSSSTSVMRSQYKKDF